MVRAVPASIKRRVASASISRGGANRETWSRWVPWRQGERPNTKDRLDWLGSGEKAGVLDAMPWVADSVYRLCNARQVACLCHVHATMGQDATRMVGLCYTTGGNGGNMCVGTSRYLEDVYRVAGCFCSRQQSTLGYAMYYILVGSDI